MNRIPPQPPRWMVVCDLDGTLLDSAGQVSPRTRSALRGVRQAGWPLLICTARPVRDVRPIAEVINPDMSAVCGNGSITYDFGQRRVVDYRPIPPTGLAATLRSLRARHPGVRLGAERDLELVLEDGFVLAEALCREARRVPALDLALDDRGFGKIIVQLTGNAQDYYTMLSSVLPGHLMATVSTSAFCEINLAGATKAAAVQRIAARSGFSARDVVAFGDMPNDLEVLAWAGTAVAVANAHPEVLAVADLVTASNDDDGVARQLERLLQAPRSSPSAALQNGPAL
ncbi:MAG TPA: HAD family hydrolase [Streptosporangiaceae bacterium]|nr:HAD family hydrolase [Streptosporangiaceae bacterium]